MKTMQKTVMGMMAVMVAMLATPLSAALAPRHLERLNFLDECQGCEVDGAASSAVVTIDFECLDLGASGPLSFTAGGVRVEIQAVGGEFAVVNHAGPMLGERSLTTDVDVCLSDENAYGYIAIGFTSTTADHVMAGVEWVAATMTSNPGHEDQPPRMWCCLDYLACTENTPYAFGPPARYQSWPSTMVYRGNTSYGGYPAITTCYFEQGIIGSLSYAISLQP